MSNCEHEAPGSGITCAACRKRDWVVAVADGRPFAEADARLGGMHGDAPVERICGMCGLRLLGTEVHGCDLARLEAKLDALILALRAGAIGKWTL